MYSTFADCVVMTESPSCAQAFVLFTGMRQGMMMPPWEFLRAARLEDRNLAIVRDPSNRGYRCDLSEEVDGLASLTDFVGRYLRERPHVQELHCVGTSAGGYPALLMGHELRARHVVALGPRPVRIDERGEPVVDDTLVAELVQRLRRPNGVTRYTVYYVRSNDTDVAVAGALRGCPGVELRAVAVAEDYPHRETPEWDHIVARIMAHDGSLARVFDPHVAAPEPELGAGS